ncbi:hypothetical protein FAIPA1_210089 [Frankia sp. AiPs1]
MPVGFRARGRVTIPTTSGLHRVDRMNLIPSHNQRGHPRATVRFDADHDITCFCVVRQVIRDQRVEPGYSRGSLREPFPRQPPTRVALFLPRNASGQVRRRVRTREGCRRGDRVRGCRGV